MADGFKELSIKAPFWYCKDEEYQYIVDMRSGKVIYKKEYTNYSESCFCFCGDTDAGPVFYDARYSTYLYPTEKGYKIYSELFNFPVIINRYNVVNIVESEEGIGVIDPYGKSIIKNDYDSIKIELKITAVKGEKTENKIIPLPKDTFEKGEITDIDKWV